MLKFYMLIFTSILIQSSFAQGEWQEHLSHDRRAYAHFGHFVVGGDIVLLMGNETTPMNTLEVITGKTKKNRDIISEYFTFSPKTTRTGIDSKEILLKEPFDYDISGVGAFSIHEKDDVFFHRDIQGQINPDEIDYLFIIDAFMSGDSLDSKQCIANDSKHYVLNYLDEIEMATEFEGEFAFHEGLDGMAYQIANGVFRNTTFGDMDSLDLGSYSKLLNNPYGNQLIKMEGSKMSRYSYDDYVFNGSQVLVKDPIDILFVENGFYYLTEAEESYTVYFHSDMDVVSNIYYELLKNEDIVDFTVNNFDIIGEDIYFLGLLNSSLIQESFSYVQKRTLNKDFVPFRKDIALTEASASSTLLEFGYFEYQYNCKVSNLSTDTIRHFTLYIGELYSDFGPDQYVKNDITVTLAPGETQNIEGSFTYPFKFATLPFNIIGVDFGIDSDESNNSVTADVTSLANEDIEIKNYSISPNPSTELIFIDGEIDEIKSISIIDLSGHKAHTIKGDYKTIRINTLPKGQYWMQINTTSNSELHSFIKI